MIDAPWVTPDLAGIGGHIKAAPVDFDVEEIPSYEPSGEGEHVWLVLTREGRTTREVERALARLFGVELRDVGCAGMKDKVARATQAFTLTLPDDPESIGARIEAELDGLIVQSASRHGNKLRTGHLRGNRFRIVVRDVVEDAVDRARQIIDVLSQHGLPNLYGEQRFGSDNVARGIDVLVGRLRRPKWERRLLVSAVQSDLFNRWLTTRWERWGLRTVRVGDVAKTGRGGLFDVEDADVDQKRLDAREITFTGPMFGKKMRRAGGAPGALEDEILAESGLDEALARGAGDGTRRPALLHLAPIAVVAGDDALTLTFELPKGSYATVLLREIMKTGEPRTTT